MLQIGITGGIGTGKSIVSRVFALLGIPVYDSDSAAKMLMNTLPELKGQITSVFGDKSYTADGLLDRSFLAASVFNNPEKLKQLNALVHPQVGIHFRAWADAQEAPYVLKEAALIFEAGIDKKLDKVISVLAPLELRLQRLLNRDPHRSQADFEAIMEKQLPAEEQIKRAHFLIYNDEKHLVIKQVLKVHAELCKELKIRKVETDPTYPFNHSSY